MEVIFPVNLMFQGLMRFLRLQKVHDLSQCQIRAQQSPKPTKDTNIRSLGITGQFAYLPEYVMFHSVFRQFTVVKEPSQGRIRDQRP